jgi:outer membrane protein assembly factor BamB
MAANAQTITTAVVCDPQIGSENGEEFFVKIIEDINNRTDIELFVVLGNITHNGLYEEFLTFESIMSRINIPYRIVIGPNDILLSETRGEEINQMLPENRKSFQSHRSDKLFLQTIPFENSGKGHIPVETIKLFSPYNSTRRTILIYSIISSNDIDNWIEFQNLFEGQHIIPFSTFQDDKDKGKQIPGEISFNSLSKNKEWIYNLIQELPDTISISKISEKLTQPELIEIISIRELAAIIFIDSSQIISYLPGIKIEEPAHNESTTYTPILNSNNRIFSATKKGKIYCHKESGEKLWEYNTSGSIFNSVQIDRDLLIAVTQEGDIYTINVNNGDLFQVLGIGEYISSDINLIELEYNDIRTRGIVFGTTSGNIYCYELYSMEMVWSNYISENSITSKPLILNNNIIFQDGDENYYCVNSDNGVLIWKWNAGIKQGKSIFRSDFVSNDNSIYISGLDGNIYSIDILLGTINWIKKKENSSGRLHFSSSRSSLFVHSTKNKITELNSSKGKVISEINLPDDFNNSLPSAWLEYANGILIGFDNGVVGRVDKNNNFSKIIFTGNAPVISILQAGLNKFIINNLDGKFVRFTLP